MLRGMMGGAAVMVGLPLLDCFLDENGTTLASGAPLPQCFSSWFAGLGLNAGRWEPKIIGAKYDMAPELEALTPFKDRINIYSGMRGFLDGKPLGPHGTGPQICLSGGIPKAGEATAASIDQLIADAIGTRTRFRSLEVACHGVPQSYSRRGGSTINPADTSPVALYSRVFGPEFKDPNAADFTPDPKIMVRRSVLSAVADQRQEITKDFGVADKARVDEYFTALRQLEQQLDLQLQKPAPLESCTPTAKSEEAPPGQLIDDALSNHKLFAQILAHAVACGQTRVINVNFGGALSNLRKAGSAMTFHMYTHEEAIDPKLGYQPETTWFMTQVIAALGTMLGTLQGIREGAGTVLDRVLVLYSTDTGFAKYHSLENLPILTVGNAGGRMKTGLHIKAAGDPVTRVGLTIQQAMGVPLNSWGTDSNQTSKTIADVMA